MTSKEVHVKRTAVCGIESGNYRFLIDMADNSSDGVSGVYPLYSPRDQLFPVPGCIYLHSCFAEVQAHRQLLPGEHVRILCLVEGPLQLV